MAQHVATEQLTITDWVKGLAAIPGRDFTLENVQDYIIRHSARPGTLDKYCYFSKGNYTRNLIFKNEVFECMTICWEIGQASRIHNHRDQNCWMSAPIGRLKVQNSPSASTFTRSLSILARSTFVKKAPTAMSPSTTPANTAN